MPGYIFKKMNNNSDIKIAVAGASGYVGAELLRYLSGHPNAVVKHCCAHSQSGSMVTDLFPQLTDYSGVVLESPDWDKLAEEVDVVFLCLPHGTSQKAVATLLGGNCKVVDLGADFRLKSAPVYQATYGSQHLFPGLLCQAVYGLPELYREAIGRSRLVANPGCYPTASALAVLPLLARKALIGPTIIDAKSGVSGAGRAAKVSSLFCEVNENFKAYGVGGHRHQSEIEQTLGSPVIFTPHLVPMTRGILATVYVEHAEDLDVQKLYQEFYCDEPFVNVLTDSLPETKTVRGSNYSEIAIRPSGLPGRSVIVSTIDNLGKGAAGAAVQNMNILFQLKETTGLSAPVVAP